VEHNVILALHILAVLARVAPLNKEIRVKNEELSLINVV
jgi:hypothetical protein